MKTITRDEAFALLKKYNKDPFHIQHALTVEAVMKWYARELGYGAEEEHWGIVGLLHDIDFELYPAEHCLKAPELLRELRLRGQRVNGFFSSRRLYPQPGRVSLANSGGWRLYPSSATARRKSSSGLRGSCSSRPLLPKRTL